MAQEEIRFTPENVFVTTELHGVEKPYTVASPDGALIALNTLRVEKLPASEGGFEVEEPSTFVMMAGLWGRATHVPLTATLARFGDVVGIAQPESKEAEIPFRRINKKDFDNTGFAQLWVMEKMGLKGVYYWGISEGAATGIAAAAWDAQEVTEGKHKPIIDTLVLVAPGGMIDQRFSTVVLNFIRSIRKAVKRESDMAYERAISRGLPNDEAKREASEAVQAFMKTGEAFPKGLPQSLREKLPPFGLKKLLNWGHNAWLLSQDVTLEACKKIKCDVVYVAGEEDLIAQPWQYQQDDSLLEGLRERLPNARTVKVITVPHRGHDLPVAEADLLSFEVVRKILALKPVRSEKPKKV